MLTPALAGALLLGLICLVLMEGSVAALVVAWKGAVAARKQRATTTDTSTMTLLKSPLVPAVAIVVVAPPAGQDAYRHVRRLLNLHFGNCEIVLVLDGPSPSELALWMKEFHLEPCLRSSGGALDIRPVRGVYASGEPLRLVVVDQQRVGEDACLNTGVDFAEAPVIATVDPDAQFSDEALALLIQPMIADPDGVMAVCAMGPARTDPGLIANLHRLESLETWLENRGALAAWNAVLPAHAGFVLMNRDAVIRARGFRAGAMEMVIRLNGQARAEGSPVGVRFLQVPAGPLTPRSMQDLFDLGAKDRLEAQRALGGDRERSMGFGELGRWHTVPVLIYRCYVRPLIEIGGLILAVPALVLGWMEPAMIGLLLATTLAFRILASMSAVLLAEYAAETEAGPRDLASLFFSAVPENIGYRQWRDLRTIGNWFSKRKRVMLRGTN